jgi:hypothetical protein
MSFSFYLNCILNCPNTFKVYTPGRKQPEPMRKGKYQEKESVAHNCYSFHLQSWHNFPFLPGGHMQMKPPCGRASHVDPAVQGWERHGSTRSWHKSPAANNTVYINSDTLL